MSTRRTRRVFLFFGLVFVASLHFCDPRVRTTDRASPGVAADFERSRECYKAARFEALLAAIATACPDQSGGVHSSD